jgi:hypothetical protein
LAISAVNNRSYMQVPAETTLQELVERHLPNVAARAFVVQRDGAAIGLLTWYHINAVPRGSWRTTTVAQAMTPIAVEYSSPLDRTLRAARAEAPIAPEIAIRREGAG